MEDEVLRFEALLVSADLGDHLSMRCVIDRTLMPREKRTHARFQIPLRRDLE
jgi:hypothetical protein